MKKEPEKTYQLLVIDDDPADCELLYHADCLGPFIDSNELKITLITQPEEVELEGGYSKFDGILVDWIFDIGGQHGEDILPEVKEYAPNADLWIWTKSTNLGKDTIALIEKTTEYSGKKISVLLKPIDPLNVKKYESGLKKIGAKIGSRVKAKLSGEDSPTFMVKRPFRLRKGSREVLVSSEIRTRLLKFIGYMNLRGVNHLDPQSAFYRVFNGWYGYGTVVANTLEEPHFHAADGKQFRIEDWSGIWKKFSGRVKTLHSKLKNELFVEALSIRKQRWPYNTDKLQKSNVGVPINIPPDSGLDLTDDEGNRWSIDEFRAMVLPFGGQELIGSEQAINSREGNATLEEFNRVANLIQRERYLNAQQACNDGDWLGSYLRDPPVIAMRLQVAIYGLLSDRQNAEYWRELIYKIHDDYSDIQQYFNFEQAIVWDFSQDVLEDTGSPLQVGDSHTELRDIMNHSCLEPDGKFVRIMHTMPKVRRSVARLVQKYSIDTVEHDEDRTLVSIEQFLEFTLVVSTERSVIGNSVIQEFVGQPDDKENTNTTLWKRFSEKFVTSAGEQAGKKTVNFASFILSGGVSGISDIVQFLRSENDNAE